MLDKLKLEDFSQCLNQGFRIHVEGSEPIATELIEARGLVAPDDDPDRRRHHQDRSRLKDSAGS